LQNVIERAVILTQGQSLQLEKSFGFGDVGNGGPSGTTGTTSARLEEVERAHILHVLQECGWRIKGKANTAERLGLHPSTLLHRLKRLGIERPLSRSNAEPASVKGSPLKQDLEAVERACIIRALEETRWTIKGEGNAASRLDVTPSGLRSRMKKLGIKRPG
jgi:transcriptional regulator with GAF, ATPase, and Fis domain